MNECEHEQGGCLMCLPDEPWSDVILTTLMMFGVVALTIIVAVLI